MRSIVLAAGIFLTILSGVVLENRAQAQTYVNIDIFYEQLSPYGGWSPHVEFGTVWQPYNVGPEWKPYSDGRWEYSDQGWIWISYEPWGWATYHYGRWVYDDYQGWIWIPGTTWAPAWVSWHQSPEYIGWAPLPPDRGFFLEIGISFNFFKPYYYKPYRYKRHHNHHRHHYKKHRYYHDYYYSGHDYRPPARHCVFLPHDKFGHHKHAGQAAVLNPQDAIVFRNARNITNIKRVNNTVINYGPDKHYIEKRANKKLVTHRIVDSRRDAVRGKRNLNAVNNGTYNAYRPNIQRNAKRNPFIKNKGTAASKRSNHRQSETLRDSQHRSRGVVNKNRAKSNAVRKQNSQNTKHSVSRSTVFKNKAPAPSKIQSRSGSNTAVNKTHKSTKGQDTYRLQYRAPSKPAGKGQYKQAPRQHKKSGPAKHVNTQRGSKPKGNNFSQSRYAPSQRSPKAKGYNKPQVQSNKQAVRKPVQKSTKGNYSNRNKSPHNGNSKGYQNRSYGATYKSSPSSRTSQRRAFSRR